MASNPFEDFIKTLKDETDRIKNLIREKLRDDQ